MGEGFLESMIRGIVELNEKSKELVSTMGQVNESFKGLLDNLGQLNETGGQVFNKLDELFYKLNDVAIEMINGSTGILDLLDKIKTAIFTIGKAVIMISFNPFITAFLGAAAAVALVTKGLLEAQRRFVELDTAAQDFRENTGFTKDMISKELNSAIVGSSVFAQKSASAAAALANEYGNIDLLTKNVVKTTVQLSERLGISEQNAAGFLDKMQNIYGLSSQTSRSIAQSVAYLAMASGVAPDRVFGDIQNLSEETLSIIGNYPGKLASAAVKARQLGMDINNVARAAKQLLDIESAIQAEMEASVLLGRQINMDKARELTLAGDLEGAMKEILAQTGGITEFNRLNMIQKEALAKAAGIDLTTLQRTLEIQDKLTKSGKLSKETQEKISQALKTGNVELAEQLLNQNRIDGAVRSREKNMKSAMDKIAAMFMDIYEKFRPIVDKLIKMIEPLAQKFVEALEKSGVLDFLEDVADYIIKFIENIDLSSDTFKSIFDTLKNIFEFTRKLFGGLFTFFEGLFTGNESKMKQGMDQVTTMIKSFFKAVNDFLFKEENGERFIDKLLSWVGKGILELLKGLWNIISSKEFLTLLWNGLTFLIKLPFKIIVGVTEFLAGLLKDAIMWVWDTVVNYFKNLDLGKIWEDIVQKGRILKIKIKGIFFDLDEEDKKQLAEYEKKKAEDAAEALRKAQEEANKQNQKAFEEAAKKQSETLKEQTNASLDELMKGVNEKSDESLDSRLKKFGVSVETAAKFDAKKIKKALNLLTSPEMKQAIDFFAQNQNAMNAARDFFVSVKQMGDALEDKLKSVPDTLKSLTTLKDTLKSYDAQTSGANIQATNDLSQYFNVAKVAAEDFSATIEKLALISLEHYKNVLDKTLDISQDLKRIDLNKIFLVDKVDKLERIATALELIAKNIESIDIEKYFAVTAAMSGIVVRPAAMAAPQKSQEKFDFSKLSAYDAEKMMEKTKKDLEIDDKKKVEDIIKSKKNDPTIVLLYQILLTLRDGLQIDGYKISKSLG